MQNTRTVARIFKNIMMFSLPQKNSTPTQCFVNAYTPSKYCTVQYYYSSNTHTRTMASSIAVLLHRSLPIVVLLAIQTTLTGAFRHVQHQHPLRPSRGSLSELRATTHDDDDDTKLYPRAAVAVALRWCCPEESSQPPQYLLIQRGTEPNKGKWSLPGGKLEWGEGTLDGAKRELSEEVLFDDDDYDEQNWNLAWARDPYATADSITENNNSPKGGFHYVIAVCFAELSWKGGGNSVEKLLPPTVTAADDAMDARWWSMDEIAVETLTNNAFTPGFVRRIQRTEFLYQQGVLVTDER